MKRFSYFPIILLAGALTLFAQTPTAEQMKTDLIGQTMGGRHQCWKFQSLDQIKELAVKGHTGDAQKQIYTVALQLQATNAPARYAADARVEYTQTGTGWKIQQVGLLSLKKIK